MIDERFSPSAFERLRDDAHGLARLQDDLQREVLAEVRPAVEAAMAAVAAQLNAQGHALTREPPDEEFDSVGYADGTIDARDLRLWVNHHPTVTAGYAGVETSR
jgi:hypothetical protein